MSPRPDVSEERKKQILDAAMAVFSRMGFHKARMDDIVEESGLSKGTLYWYFKSKDDIIIALLKYFFEREFTDLETILHGEEPVSDRLKTFVEFTMEDVRRMLDLLPLTFEFYALSLRQESIHQFIKDYFHRYMEALDPVIQEGINQGEFQPVNARDVTIALGAIVEGTLLLWIYDPDSIDISHHAQTSLKFLLEGVQVKDSS